MAENPLKNGKESCQKDWLSKENINLSLARKTFKNPENIMRKLEDGNIRRKREVSGQNRRVGISAVEN